MPRPQAMEQHIPIRSAGNRAIRQPERPGYNPGNPAVLQFQNPDTYRSFLKTWKSTTLATTLTTTLTTTPSAFHTDTSKPPRTTRCYKRTTTTTRSKA
jgi:hypothetical protein